MSNMTEKEFEKQTIEYFKRNGFAILANPQPADLLIEKDKKKISIVMLTASQQLSKSIGNLLASKTLHKTNELWIISDRHISFSSQVYADIIKENGIKIMVFDGSLAELLKKQKKDRAARGIDYEKIAKIWSVLAAANDWLHVAEIARRTKIKEPTVRWYLDNYLKNAIEEERIVPQIKLRLVKLKPNLDIKSYLKAIEFIKQVKKTNNKQNSNRI